MFNESLAEVGVVRWPYT